MHCPKFIDSTRECRKDIESLPTDTLVFCTTERYLECPFYILLEKKGPACENIPICVVFKNFCLGDFEAFVKITKDYCLTEKNVECKRYIIKKSGQKPPDDLLPDGTSLK